jgi:glycosyltransferase involved in cell wall biosynthesis
MTTHDKPTVSIVLCFYNEETFIDEAIASVMNQDFTSWELLLIDDGSSDTSTQKAKDYARRYHNKVFYFRHPGHCNEGLSASRNLGIQKSRGEYIAFLDADDVWYENKLTSQLKIFDRQPGVTVILESSLYWKSWAGNEDDVLINVGAREGVYQPPQLMLKLYPLGAGAAPCPSGIIAHRSVFDRCEFEESFKGIFQMYEDQAFLCKVYLTEKVYVSHACHNKYRQRASSLVSSVYENGKYDMVRRYYLQWFRTYLKHKRILSKTVWALLDFANMPYREPFKYRITQVYPQKVKVMVDRILSKVAGLTLSK